MSNSLISSSVAFIIPFVISFLLLYAITFWLGHKRKKKHNPLTDDLLRNPGESLRLEIENLSERITNELIIIVFFPPILYSGYISQLYFGATKFNALTVTLTVLAASTWIAFSARKMSALIEIRNNYRLGFEAEMAVGQELNQLMMHGFHVFHDFPEKKNNIDHIVVGPSGVFAVETKGRAKPEKKGGKVDFKVSYDGQHLIFPNNFKTSEPINQAKKQAASLSKFIAKKASEKVYVKPALAIPGWLVTRTKPDNFVLLYGQHQNYLQVLQGKTVLNKDQITRIVGQLEEKCRDVKTMTYKK